MGKKARKTRWRTLEITDEQSDSEDSQITASQRLPKTFQQKTYYNKLPYSSQSTPRRKYQYDSTQSTRSSSTTSENKITFNEDEYTRITTPRQDVLFKKGYLNKPKTYQTQTSTGTSTTSTGNSTGNGTPDHQSTDLEYDSQFVFPNGFVDQNGIYYVNSFEPYPLMLYNPPTYYSEFSNIKSKRYSTGSLTESTSPNNEEATSQDLSGGEASNNVSDYSSHHSVYNMVYPGYYINGVCTSQEIEDGQPSAEQPRKIKKRRKRKTSRSQSNNQDESTDGSEDENVEDSSVTKPEESTPNSNSVPAETNPTDEKTTSINKEENEVNDKTSISFSSSSQSTDEEVKADSSKPQKYDLKPDAEEFVPRAYRTPEIPLSPVQFIKIPPNFVQIPVVPYNGQINPAFIPPGSIPINYLPSDPKLFPPNFINFAPSHPKVQEIEKPQEINETPIVNNTKVCDTNSNTAKIDAVTKSPEKITNNAKTIDIATIVSKLEEAAKEQDEQDEDKTKICDPEQSPKKKSFRNNQKYKNHYKRNFYNSPRNSPQRQIINHTTTETNNEIKNVTNDNTESQSSNKFVKNNSEYYKKNWKNNNNNNKWLNGSYKNSKPNSPKHVSADPIKTNPKIKEPEAPSLTKVSSPNKLPNQWISVSSRKKRKNKGLEDEASFEEPAEIEEQHQDEFESYDVDKLIDVIPPNKIEEAPEDNLKVEIVIEEKIENILTNIAQNESENIQNNNLTNDIPLVTEIEDKLIVKEELEKVPDLVEEIIEINPQEESKEENCQSVNKKKSKKSTQKTNTKRVIITDVDLSNKYEEVKTPVKKVVKKLEKKSEDVPLKEETIQIEPEEDKKKNKKKKKKPVKLNEINTNGCVSVEDAYDLLLDKTITTETDKTNDEISLELDKMIQKGIYSNLEEKIKSLNLNETDGFFKSIFNKVPLSTRPEPVGFLKSPDFTKIPLVKDPVSEDQNLELENKKINELPASDSPKILLENPDPVEESKSLYPITEAVKEWMCKTRETTPDVEIFKSPSTIYKELLYESDSNSDTEVWNSRNLSDEISASVEEDEVTIFTTEEISKKDEDLLDYWEDLKLENTEKIDATTESQTNEDDDELEVYESKYGNNEDFIRLQKEVREKYKSMNHPKNGNLPYKAVCCNLM